MKILIAFYTTYGTNHGIAEYAAEIARETGAEVRLRRFRETVPMEIVETQEAWKAQLDKMKDIPEISTDDMEWADGMFWSVPTRYGNTAGQVRAFVDTLGPLWGQGKLADKTFSAASTAQNMHGGQVTTLLSMYQSVAHWGSIVVTPGYTDEALLAAGGCPHGYAGKGGGFDDAGRAAVAHQVRRLIDYTRRIAA